MKMVTNFNVPSKTEEFLGKQLNYYRLKKDTAQCSTLTVNNPGPLTSVKAKCICLRLKGDMFNPGAWNNFGQFNKRVTRYEDKHSLQLSHPPSSYSLSIDFHSRPSLLPLNMEAVATNFKIPALAWRHFND